MSLETENILEPFKMDPFVLKAGHLDDNPNIFYHSILRKISYSGKFGITSLIFEF